MLGGGTLNETSRLMFRKPGRPLSFRYARSTLSRRTAFTTLHTHTHTTDRRTRREILIYVYIYIE